MIGAIIFILELLAKFMVLTVWLMVLMIIGMVWLIAAIVTVCMKAPVPEFPRSVSRTTNSLLHWML